MRLLLTFKCDKDQIPDVGKMHLVAQAVQQVLVLLSGFVL